MPPVSTAFQPAATLRAPRSLNCLFPSPSVSLHRCPRPRVPSVVHSPRATLDFDTKFPSAEPSTSLEKEVVHLSQEQLKAYYDADEPYYQTSLSNVFRLALRNFSIELGEIFDTLRRIVGSDPPLRSTPPECLNFQLSNDAVAERERHREVTNGEIQASPFVRQIYRISCKLLDLRFDGRPIPRFWVLETVARMPYFAYSSCLHLFATLGWFRSPTLMNIHHAEELNEAYHLSVMESLGGDKRWGDRFLAFHAAILYYWCLVILFLVSPREAYRFSQLVEIHAVETYREFLEANEALLRSLPAPDVAQEYFENFMYYFCEFQLTGEGESVQRMQRPEINSLYDVFQNILLDETEHSETMEACTNYISSGTQIWYNGKCISGSSRRPPTKMPVQKQQDFWQKWNELQEKQKR